MRIFRDQSAKCRVQKNFLLCTLLFALCTLSACHDTIEYYKRGEGYASEQINSGVNEALQCDDANKGKSYCDDSTTNREKKHNEEMAAQAKANGPQPAVKVVPSQTPMQVSKGPVSPEPGTQAVPESKPVQPGAAVITPLTPEEKVVAPTPAVVKKPEAQAKKKPTPNKPKKKKPVKKSAKKPIKKKVKKPVEKPKAQEKPKGTGGAGGNQGAAPNAEGPIVDKPLLPRTTDDMLGIDKIVP